MISWCHPEIYKNGGGLWPTGCRQSGNLV